MPANLGFHPVWHAEHLRRAASGLRRPQEYNPVLQPPLRIERVLAHKRLPGRGLNYELTVKYLDRPLGFLPDKLPLRDALTRGSDVVRAYFHQWKLGELQ